jgi:hypothetical protein
MTTTAPQNGKGSRPRRVNGERYRREHIRIFRKNPKNPKKRRKISEVAT